jgi:hypothetical protein
VETGIGHFYAYTLWAGPALLGYLLGRWVPAPIRVLPLVIILTAGYLWTWYSDHGFSGYVLGNLVYAGFCAGGLWQRAKDRKVSFWSLHHYDWITVLVATLVMRIAYLRPEL